MKRFPSSRCASAIQIVCPDDPPLIRSPNSNARRTIGSNETHCCQTLPIDYAIGWHVVVALVSANCSSRLRPHDAINGAVIVPGASKSALHLYNPGIAIAISVIAVSVVGVRIVAVIGIGIRIEERESKRVDKDERSVVVETAEAIAKKPMRARHGARRKAWCWPRHRGSRHH